MISLLFAVGVAAAPPASPDGAGYRLNQRQLDGISARCGTPKAWLRSRNGVVRMRPAPNANYRQVDCVLTELRRQDPRGPIGFIGNEAANPKKPEQPR